MSPKLTVVGIDPSLTSLGLAAVSDGSIVATKRVRSAGHNGDTLAQRYARQEKIVGEVLAFLNQHRPVLVVIEGPSYGSRNGHPHDRSGLWWAIVSVALRGSMVANQKVAVVEVPPNNRMKYATGHGRVEKDVVLAQVIWRYPEAEITGNDVADAVVLAAMGSRSLGMAVEGDLPLTHLAAMNKVIWQKVSPIL